MSTICWVKSRRLSTSTTTSFFSSSSRAGSCSVAAAVVGGSGCGRESRTKAPVTAAVAQVKDAKRMAGLPKLRFQFDFDFDEAGRYCNDRAPNTRSYGISPGSASGIRAPAAHGVGCPFPGRW